MADFTFGPSKNSPAVSFPSKNEPDFAFRQKADVFGGAGYATGLIISPTYPEAVLNTSWSFPNKN